MDGVIEKVASGQNGLFTKPQARSAGASPEMVRHRLRTGRWHQIHPGVFALLGVPLTPLVLVHAAVLATGDDAVASHSTAAALLGIPGFSLDGMPVHVTARSYTHRRRTPAVVHGTLRLPRHHQRLISGVPCTSVARTLFDLCGQVRPHRAERALDNALAKRLVTIAALWRVLDDAGEHGRAGSGGLRRLLVPRAARYVAPESELEARFVDLARMHGLPQPERQVDIGNSHSWIGRVDFAYPSRRLIMECDGRMAHTELLDRQADDERDRLLRASGWTVLRFTWSDVIRRPKFVADSARAALDISSAAA